MESEHLAAMCSLLLKGTCVFLLLMSCGMGVCVYIYLCRYVIVFGVRNSSGLIVCLCRILNYWLSLAFFFFARWYFQFLNSLVTLLRNLFAYNFEICWYVLLMIFSYKVIKQWHLQFYSVSKSQYCFYLYTF